MKIRFAANWHLLVSLLCFCGMVYTSLGADARPTSIEVNGKSLRDIVAVELMRDGQVSIKHDSGVGKFDPAYIPRSFLESWGINAASITKAKEEASAHARRLSDMPLVFAVTRPFNYTVPGRIVDFIAGDRFLVYRTANAQYPYTLLLRRPRGVAELPLPQLPGFWANSVADLSRTSDLAPNFRIQSSLVETSQPGIKCMNVELHLQASGLRMPVTFYIVKKPVTGPYHELVGYREQNYLSVTVFSKLVTSADVVNEAMSLRVFLVDSTGLVIKPVDIKDSDLPPRVDLVAASSAFLQLEASNQIYRTQLKTTEIALKAAYDQRRNLESRLRDAEAAQMSAARQYVDPSQSPAGKIAARAALDAAKKTVDLLRAEEKTISSNVAMLKAQKTQIEAQIKTAK